MSDPQGNLNFSDMVSWLREEFIKDGYDISDTYEEDPHLPIDLFCTKKNGATKEYCIVIVASINKISQEFQKKLFFYQYFLSLHYEPSQYKIVLAIPDSATVETTPYYAETKKEKKQDFYKENGFGLWKIKDKDNIDKGTYSDMTLRDKIAKDFKDIIAKEDEDKELLIKKIPKILPFVDRYIHDSVNGIAGLYPVKFEQRYIDVKLLEKMLKLENVSYKKDLFDATSKHLSHKDNEYEFVRDVFSKLWGKWIGVSYNDFLETFDPALQHVFAGTREKDRIVYRDHYLHQFQVFLLGLYIVDKLYEDFAIKYNCKKPEISWLIISSFHDIAYPVQLYDEWSGKFFKQIFGVSEDIAHIDLKSKFVEQSFMNCTNSLIARLSSVFFKEKLEGNWLSKKRELVQFFYEKITKAKNHCILSSVSLLKMVQDEYKKRITIGKTKFEDIYQDIIIPSALAIALHDGKIWQELKDKGKWQKLKEKVPLPFLRFDDDPLSFLLIFCDNIQEWGRPSQTQIGEKEERRKKFYLGDLKYDPKKGFDITIWTPNYLKGEKFFTDKQDELREIQSFLQQPKDRKFTVHLRDRDDKGEDFTMQGPPSS
jgi:hypothetical protein